MHYPHTCTVFFFFFKFLAKLSIRTDTLCLGNKNTLAVMRQMRKASSRGNQTQWGLWFDYTCMCSVSDHALSYNYLACSPALTILSISCTGGTECPSIGVLCNSLPTVVRNFLSRRTFRSGHFEINTVSRVLVIKLNSRDDNSWQQIPILIQLVSVGT